MKKAANNGRSSADTGRSDQTGDREGTGRYKMEMTADTIGRFKDLVYDRCHLTFPVSREPQFRRLIARRAEEGKHRSLADYYQALVSSTAEFEQLLSLITTRETYFFRMPEHFEALEQFVLPGIVDREGKKAMAGLARGEKYRMRLEVLSAGCATGQETHSLAMQVLDSIRYPKAWDISITGTDINPDALETARRAVYGTLRLGKTPPRFIEQYFIPLSPEEIMLSEEVRELTRFETMNLRNLPAMNGFKGRFDIIFCRNVMIYFDLPAQQRLVAALTDCLRPGGYLFTGEGEVLHLYDHSLTVVEKCNTIFYQRPEGA